MRDWRGMEKRLALEDLREEIREESGEFGEFASRRLGDRLRPARGAAGEAEPIGCVEVAIDVARGLRSRSLQFGELLRADRDLDVQSLGVVADDPLTAAVR